MPHRSVAVLALVFVAACGSPDEGAEAESPQTAVQEQAPPPLAEACELPEAFPAETPPPPECVSVGSPNDYGGIITVSVVTRSSQEELIAFYDEALPEAGFEITTRADRQDGGLSLIVEGHDARMFLELTPRAPGASTDMRVQYVLR